MLLASGVSISMAQSMSSKMPMVVHICGFTAINTRHHCLKLNSKVKFSGKEFGLGGGSRKTMIEMVKTLTNRDDGVDVEHDTSVARGGFESTLNRLSKWIISGLFLGLVLMRHDGEAWWALIGAVFNDTLSIGLKRVLNQERPDANMRSDPGMPSSHAQSIFYIFSFMMLSIVERMGIHKVSLLLSGLVFSPGVYLSWLRVSQQLHTVPQVVVGAAIGSSFFSMWIYAWKVFVTKAFESKLAVVIGTFSVAAGLCLGFTSYLFRNDSKEL